MYALVPQSDPHMLRAMNPSTLQNVYYDYLSSFINTTLVIMALPVALVGLEI